MPITDLIHEQENKSTFTYSGGLTEFPRELFALEDSLEILDLSNNNLHTLPDDFGRFQKLRIVFFSENQFTELPEVLSSCPNLTMIGFKSNQIVSVPHRSIPTTTQWLILTNNKIQTLPDSLGNCKNLQKVALAGNQLTELPETMKKCINLELLRISANKLQSLPLWLLELPRLTWLAFSGNPCTFEPESSDSLEEIHWDQIEVKEILGHGASGVISKATLADRGEEVAIKLFKGEMTSDGYPADEMKTCITAGFHPHIVPIKGIIKNHPEKKDGVILGLIPEEYSVLGKPPTFVTCTRDVFDEDFKLNSTTTKKIIAGVESAINHLHDRGIIHGDIYAHNTFFNAEGHAYLGDFGAATFFDRQDAMAELLKNIDKRALKCLSEDLWQRTE